MSGDLAALNQREALEMAVCREFHDMKCGKCMACLIGPMLRRLGPLPPKST